MPASVTIRYDSTGLIGLGDKQMWLHAEEQIIDRGISIFLPLARAEAPSRTGRSRGQISAVSKLVNGHPVGTIHTGKAFGLRILSVGAQAHDIGVFRFKSARRSKRAGRALGPGRARGAMRALRFTGGRGGGGGGEYTYRLHVRHPGVRANPFLERAAARGGPAFALAADAAVQSVLDAV